MRGNGWGYGYIVGHELITIDAGWYILSFYMFEIFPKQGCFFFLRKDDKQGIRISLIGKVTYAVECSACTGHLPPCSIKKN